MWAPPLPYDANPELIDPVATVAALWVCVVFYGFILAFILYRWTKKDK